MDITETEVEIEEAPDWISDMDFCHISPDDSELGWQAYCGHGGPGGVGNGPTCGYYRGEAICPDCGQPTCPRCAQLEALQVSLDRS